MKTVRNKSYECVQRSDDDYDTDANSVQITYDGQLNDKLQPNGAYTSLQDVTIKSDSESDSDLDDAKQSTLLSDSSEIYTELTDMARSHHTTKQTPDDSMISTILTSINSTKHWDDINAPPITEGNAPTPVSVPDHLNLDNSNHLPDLPNSNTNMDETQTNDVAGEGFDFNAWTLQKLKEIANGNEEEWRKYYANFQKHKITEDVLIALATDKEHKTEMWKELLPLIGPRIKFIEA